MIKYRWFRYLAMVVVVGFIAVCSIAIGGAVINTGHSMGLKNTLSAVQSDDWRADWQWVPSTLASTYHRPASSTLFITYRATTRTLILEDQRQTLYAGTGSIASEKGYTDHQGGAVQRVATPLHIHF